MRTQSQLKSNSELRREARCMLRMLVWARDNAQFDLGDSTLASKLILQSNEFVSATI